MPSWTTTSPLRRPRTTEGPLWGKRSKNEEAKRIENIFLSAQRGVWKEKKKEKREKKKSMRLFRGRT